MTSYRNNFSVEAPAEGGILATVEQARFSVEDPSRNLITEGRLIGRVTQVWYESRATRGSNAVAVGRLRLLAAGPDFTALNAVLVVANVAEAPTMARPFVRRALTEASRVEGVTVHADWDTTFARAMGFDPERSNLAIIDPRGRIRARYRGVLDAHQIEEASDVVRELTRDLAAATSTSVTEFPSAMSPSRLFPVPA